MVGRRHYGRWLLWAILIAGTLVLLLAIPPVPDLAPWRSGPPPKLWATASRQLEVWGKTRGRQRLRFTYVPLEQVSDHLLVAVLVGEDINFFHHKGVDLSAWHEAFRQWREGARLRGASTLTQQLAKNLFLSSRRSLWRKLAEVRIAWELERQLGKRRILELYVNIAEFGPGIFGAEAAATSYFGCSARDLTPEQAAALAATIPAPARDNPKSNSPRFRARQKIIARRMTKTSWLYDLVHRAKQRH